jgi:chromosomal replication initiation ATPase DnaA
MTRNHKESRAMNTMGHQPHEASKAIALPRIGSVAAIVREVSDATGIAAADIYGKSRMADIVRARQMVMYIARHNTKMSMQQIGKALNRDHSTVSHGVRAEAARRGI